MKEQLEKLYHKADKVNQRGGVSALCFAKPRAIDLKRANWTFRPKAVTCPKCIAQMKSNPLPGPGARRAG